MKFGSESTLCMKELDRRSQGLSVPGKEWVNRVYESNPRPDSVRSADNHWGFGLFPKGLNGGRDVYCFSRCAFLKQASAGR